MSKDEVKHKVQVSKSPEMDPPLKKMPEQEVLPLPVKPESEYSEKTKAEMEAGRKAVKEAEARLKTSD